MTRESEFGKQDRHPRRPFPENIRTRGPPIRSRGPAVPGRWRRPTRGWRGDPGPGCRWFVSNPQGDELVEGGLYGRAKHCTKHPHPEKRGLQSSNCETGGDDPEGVVRPGLFAGGIGESRTAHCRSRLRSLEKHAAGTEFSVAGIRGSTLGVPPRAK